MEKIKGKMKMRFAEKITSDAMMNKIQETMMPFATLMTYYRCAMMEIETKFKVLNEQFALQYDRNPIETIKTRIKSPEGIIRKLRKRSLPLTVNSIEENITDVAGIRIICSFPQDIYRLADYLLEQDDITLIEKKDYISNPKESGYRSLHLIVAVPIFLANEKRLMKVEVQLRTIAMDFWASLDHKLRYKKDIPAEEIQKLSYELKECAEMSTVLDLRMETIKNRLSQYSEKDTTTGIE